MPDLLSIHGLFVREHNRLAKAIGDKKPHWNDEEIFQEARRFLIASLQSIVYEEFLPVVLGEAAEDLKVNEGTKYDPDLDASIFNAFPTAAFRFGHSLIQSLIEKKDPRSGENSGSFALGPNFFEEREYLKGADDIMAGVAAQKAQKCDRFVTKEVKKSKRSRQASVFR